MTRGLTILCAVLAALVSVLPAAGSDSRSLKGVVVSLSPAAVAFKDAQNVVTTCMRSAKSPSLDGFSAGDRVQAACSRDGGHLVLRRIRHLSEASGGRANDAEPTKFAGVVTALTDASITLHDGDRDLTCSLHADSPSTADVKVGVHARVACSNGALVTIAPVASGEPGRAYEGVVTALSTHLITVHGETADATCAVGDGSPSLADVQVGDRVLIGCKAGTNQLLLVKKLPAANPPVVPPAGDHHVVTTVGGTLSALSDSSVTVHSGEKGDVTCAVNSTTPRLGDFHLGDRVGMACVDGVVAKLVKL